ncbi:sigma-70 family RNA polymerase sigma factor [Nocardia anaemiae]|uniref:sigma-70 family RNA polymerase sigma factor n=1 Tax=Nocardia anaemiae TaxID=263910 RepID=UPI0007A4E228|nr:sigma-70 family RNA polymerase sigma factor [Nocardia anaemiae]
MTQASTAHIEFDRRTQPYRRELLAHCYRMLGSPDDAEDLVQETYLRAWRAFDGFEGRSSVRTWLYQIATHACLSALRHRSRRVLPSGLGAPTVDPSAAAAMDFDVRWLGPLPDALVTDESDDPASVVAARDSLRLALIACLQQLSGKQRAVLLLRDVLDFPAAEVAELLGSTTAAVKSSLQRARARLDELGAVAADARNPTEPEQRALLDAYMTAFQNADPDAIERLLHRDAILEMPPATTWFAGKRTCVGYLATQVLGTAGDWLMLATVANGQPAAVAYHRETGGGYRAFGLAVLTTTDRAITRIAAFGDANLVTACGFPATMPEPTAP